MKTGLGSMTGFARAQGETGAMSWVWELRSVNGRGLDVKLRLPPGLDALEPGLREAVGKAAKRGNISGTCSVKREAAAGLVPDLAVLERLKELAIDLADNIPGALPPRAELLLALPGVLRPVASQDESDEQRAELHAAVQAGFGVALTALLEARAGEGARLAAIIAGLLDEIAALRGHAAEAAAAQPGLHHARLTAQLAELTGATPSLPEDRIAQEVALLATKSDVREELDRLAAHIEAARALLAEGNAVGRRLDFLMQEFNREANTLCSKSVSLPLTAIGLKLKAAIEQLREQVQNVE